MINILKAFIKKTANISVFWFLYSKCGTLADQMSMLYRYARSVRDGDVLDSREYIRRSFPDLVVKHGPFKGMKYPSPKSVGSPLLSKLLGSYELELTEVFTKILANNYTDIVDIGCAEGYYAVGLGMKFPSAKIYGFDTNNNAKRLCREMAELNGVSERLALGDFCDEMTLLSMEFAGRALVISDCEGYEKTLFTPKVAQFLAPHDDLIEVHDQFDPEISSVLKKRFEQTHDIYVVRSVDDATKVKTYDFQELAPYNLRERYTILAEYRWYIMEWFYMTPKISHGEKVTR